MRLFSLALISLLFLLLTFCVAAELGSQETPKPGQITTTYDENTDKTTVGLTPVQIFSEKAQYYSVHIAPAFSYPAHEFAKPEIVDFEVQTVVKTKLKIDLYVVFVVDGETIFLSSDRRAVQHPVPGKRWIGERLVFRMPYETLMKITSTFDFYFPDVSAAALERNRASIDIGQRNQDEDVSICKSVQRG
ncbi:hypothetical protein BH20ACI3_BH20ACI3_02020 [soil metagenome]